MLLHLSQLQVTFLSFLSISFIIGLIFLSIDTLKKIHSPNLAPTLNISLLNSLLLIASFIALLFTIQSALLKFFPPSSLPYPWSIISFGLLNQLFALLFLLATLLLFPKNFLRPINDPFILTSRAFNEGIYRYFTALPIIFLTNFLWISLLQFAKSHGCPISLAQQDIVLLFSSTSSLPFKLTIILFAAFIAPITEELIFRAFLYRFLKKFLPIPLSSILSSLTFAYVHSNILAFIPLAVLGSLLAKSYEASGNIASPITLHSLFNITTLTTLLLLPDSLNLPF